VDLFLHQQGIDTTSPGGKAMFQMLGVFAEFERSIIQERVRAGLRRAKAEGKQLGRPRIAPEMEAKILAALKARGRAQDSQAVWCRSGHGAADQPPFRRRRRGRLRRWGCRFFRPYGLVKKIDMVDK
jgi:hypothetical protein